MRQIADSLKCILNGKYVSYRVENIVRKGEIACYKQFLLFSQCFPQLCIFNAALCGNELYMYTPRFKVFTDGWYDVA